MNQIHSFNPGKTSQIHPSTSQGLKASRPNAPSITCRTSDVVVKTIPNEISGDPPSIPLKAARLLVNSSKVIFATVCTVIRALVTPPLLPFIYMTHKYSVHVSRTAKPISDAVDKISTQVLKSESANPSSKSKRKAKPDLNIASESLERLKNLPGRAIKRDLKTSIILTKT